MYKHAAALAAFLLAAPALSEPPQPAPALQALKLAPVNVRVVRESWRDAQTLQVEAVSVGAFPGFVAAYLVDQRTGPGGDTARPIAVQVWRQAPGTTGRHTFTFPGLDRRQALSLRLWLTCSNGDEFSGGVVAR